MASLRILLLASMFAVVLSQADAAETYSNPIIDDTLADPAVIEHDGTYYLYATGEVDGDNGYRAYTSKDLVHWERGPVVFQPGQPHVWAPDVWRDPDSGRFYLYYTANTTVGVADAAGPLGPFTVRRKLFDSAIDAHLFRDDDGRLYLYVVQLPGFRITVQPMANPTEPVGDPKVVLQPESEWETRNGHVTEGPWMIKRNGRYYLIYSGSGANTPDYAVGYATSDSPLGPFTRAENNPIIQRSEGLFGPGHGCAIRDGDGQWWHLYHQKRTARVEWGRFISLDPLWFDEQGQLHGRATRGTEQQAPTVKETLWQLAKAKQSNHRFSTLVTAQQVRDHLGTTAKTYVEQARQTVLAGAKESLLFCYGALLKDTGPTNVQALRPCIPELLQVAEEVGQRQIIGVAAYKPPNSHPEKESRVFDFVGMIGVPLVPCHEFPEDAQAAFFSVHSLKDSKVLRIPRGKRRFRNKAAQNPAQFKPPKTFKLSSTLGRDFPTANGNASWHSSATNMMRPTEASKGRLLNRFRNLGVNVF